MSLGGTSPRISNGGTRGAAAKFWLGGGMDSGLPNPPTLKFWFLLGFWPLYFENLKYKKLGKLLKHICKKHNFWGRCPLRILNWGAHTPIPPEQCSVPGYGVYGSTHRPSCHSNQMSTNFYVTSYITVCQRHLRAKIMKGSPNSKSARNPFR